MAFVNGQHSYLTVTSLASSILTAAFISASITIEKDIDELGRMNIPLFYGLVKLESKIQTAAVCLLVMTIAACQLASKAFAISLLGEKRGAK